VFYDCNTLKLLLRYETKHAKYLKFRCFDSFAI